MLEGSPSRDCSLDFYGAIRQATYDDVVLKWILKQVGGVSTTAEARPEQLAVLTDQLVKRPIDAVGGRKAWDEVEPGKTFMRGFDTSDLEVRWCEEQDASCCCHGERV